MLVAALLSGVLIAPAEKTPLPDAKTLERAEQQFHEGMQARERPEEARRHFQAALVAYEELRRRGIHNADLYRNLGKSARLAEDLPQGIFAYRRGLELEPGARDLQQENLEEARDLVPYPAGCRCRPEADPWPPWLPRPANPWLLTAAFVLYALACAACTRWLIVRRGLILALMIFVLAGTVGLAWGWSQWQEEEARLHPVVVVRDTAPVRTGNDNGKTYAVVQALPTAVAGMEGRLLYVRGDWLQVEFPGGEVGWLPREHLLVSR